MGAALLLAGLLGWLLAKMRVAMLQRVFDPSPDALAVPWTLLRALAPAAVACPLAVRGILGLPLGEILREQ